MDCSTCHSVSSFPSPHLFLPDDGVSIPSSYTSYLAPLSSSKLYNEVRGCRERDKDPECHFETPYVVRLHNFHQLAEPKACFTFTHPSAGAAGWAGTWRLLDQRADFTVSFQT